MTLAEFIALIPAFSELSEAQFSIANKLAASEVNADVFGDEYELAVALLTAHHAALSDEDRASGGKITSEREGDFSLSYAQSKDDLDQTQYGKQFKALRQVIVGPLGIYS